MSHKGQDSEISNLKQIYLLSKVRNLKIKTKKRDGLIQHFDYLWGDDSDEEEQEEQVDESKLHNEVDEI